jgi:glutamate-ammonia-ligase adenylyltransferase
VQEVLRAGITRPGASEVALADAAAMRRRMLRDLPADGPWDVKAMPGGLVEVEFVAQALQLAHGRGQPEVLAPATRTALARLGKAGVLPAGEAAALIRADRLWRSVLSMLRLTVGKTKEPGMAAPAAEAMLRASARFFDTPPVDLAALRAQMAEVSAEVRAIFVRRIGAVEGVGE